LTFHRKIVEYFIETWYSSFRKESKEEVMNMQDMVMRGIYEKTNSMSDNSQNKGNILQTLFYYRQLKRIAKKYDYSKYLEQNGDICGGEVVIKNTRIRPITIFNYFISLNISDMDLVLEKIKKSYPALDDDTIIASFLYCIKTNSLKKLFWQ